MVKKPESKKKECNFFFIEIFKEPGSFYFESGFFISFVAIKKQECITMESDCCCCRFIIKSDLQRLVKSYTLHFPVLPFLPFLLTRSVFTGIKNIML